MTILFEFLQARIVPFILPIHSRCGGGGFDPERVNILIGCFIFLSFMYLISLIGSLLFYFKGNRGDYSDSFISYHLAEHPRFLIGIFNGIMMLIYLCWAIFEIGKFISKTFL